MEVYSDGYVCRLRILRQKYGISLQELGRYAGIDFRHLSEIELRKRKCSDHTYQIIADAFESILRDRADKTAEYLNDFINQRSRLLEPDKEE